MSRGAFQGAVRDSQSTRVRQQKRASRRHREPIYNKKETLTQVAALVVNFELPDADWRLAPAVHCHERPPVEARTGHVQTSPVQQGRSRAPRRGQVDLQITPPASCQGDFRLKSSRHARVHMLEIIPDQLLLRGQILKNILKI